MCRSKERKLELLKCSGNRVKEAEDWILLCFVSFPWSNSTSESCREQAANPPHSPASTWGNGNVFYWGYTNRNAEDWREMVGRAGEEKRKTLLWLATASWAVNCFIKGAQFLQSTATHAVSCPVVPRCLCQCSVPCRMRLATGRKGKCKNVPGTQIQSFPSWPCWMKCLALRFLL